MSLFSLMQIVQPNGPSITRSSETSIAVAEAKYFPLPGDYKDYVSHFGLGNIGDFVVIFTPDARSQYSNLFEQVTIQGNKYKEIRLKYPEEVSFTIFPQPKGLIPFGNTDNGDILFWVPEGEPDRWTVLVAASRDARTQAFKLSMTEFLTEVLSQRVKCDLFPDDLEKVPVSFRPVVENV